ncbi:MAG: hypothetical protein ACOC3Z_03555 [Nanoarchaeota archaeon]
MDDWDECLLENEVISCSVDEGKCLSLIKVSEGRIMFLDKQKLDNFNVNYIFEGYYTSILELLHVLTLYKGLKIKNHICIGYYLRDVLKKEDLYAVFDDLRYKRNSLMYYGKEMDFDIAKDAIKKSKELLQNIRKII